MTYRAPLPDYDFVLHRLLKVSSLDIPGYGDLDPEFTGAVIEEAGKLAEEVLAPLNAVGDREGCRLENGVVRTPQGLRAAFDALREGGWTALDCADGIWRPGPAQPDVHGWSASPSSRPTWRSTCSTA